MFALQGLAARFFRIIVPRYLTGVCVFALLAFTPHAVGATAPAPAASSQAKASSGAAALPVGEAAATGASGKETTPQKATTAQGKTAKKKPQAANSKKNATGKKVSSKKTQSAKSATGSAKPGAKAKAKPAAKQGADAARRDEALKVFPISSVPKIAPAKAAKLPVADTWKPLMARLVKDGVDRAYLQGMFGRLGDSYSHVPMGTKINELFTYKYMPRPPRKAASAAEKSDAPRVYKWVLQSENVVKCKEYLDRHKEAFAVMEKTYGIPKEVVAGLLMVETKLGTYLGTSSSFWSLACLAASDTPERVDPTLQALPLPMTPDKMEWVAKLLKERSVWAYKELLALIKHCKENDLDPLVMPGSVYGAIGICQFMPSNLPKFAVDGNKDGKIDLFDPADAIPSVGNYLKKHGWEGESRDVHHKVIKRYNKSNVYANTILALAEAIIAPPVDPSAKPAASVASAEAVKKTPKGTKASGAKSGKTAKPAAKASSKSKKDSGKKTSSTGKASSGAKLKEAAPSPAASTPAKPDSEKTAPAPAPQTQAAS